ncbi:N,N-dimethylformamidase beta subunit family domain-containing protein [Actinoplanes sp. HUAS TT8]|uniref:N,N-dimethylformamidase beta subunit family domain-containing protein n=1 Tax=Actinoplanes sp. HUAS TT8 TaxID=3447453 RepID=UPI003F51D9DD
MLKFLALGAGAAATGLAVPAEATSVPRQALRDRPRPAAPVVPAQRASADALRLPVNVTDRLRQIQGYASATSVNAGDPIDFHVAVARPQPFTVTVHRIDGRGTQQVGASGELSGQPRAVPVPDPVTGLIDCDWPVSWTLHTPAYWTSGMYLAVFETRDGDRALTLFVVREDQRRSDFLMVVPFTTYAAYNMWPMDGHTGRNLYRGYLPGGKSGGIDQRAYRVSFNRPFANGGRPKLFDLDIAAAKWLESNGYDVTYATSIDLHEGRVDPARHRGLVFSGHDEYWSGAMRQVLDKAIRGGTHCAFLAANNVYWNIRMEAAGRVVTCYKDAVDPAPGRFGPTKLWRDLGPGHSHAEGRTLGVQYNGIPDRPAPLVVREAGHWLWAGTGLRDGDTIPKLVGGEADGVFPDVPVGYGAQRTVLSESPYTDAKRGRVVQNTSLSVTPEGTIVFDAGTFHWPLALVHGRYTDARIQRATRNLFNRMLAAK